MEACQLNAVGSKTLDGVLSTGELVSANRPFTNQIYSNSIHKLSIATGLEDLDSHMNHSPPFENADSPAQISSDNTSPNTPTDQTVPYNAMHYGHPMIPMSVHTQQQASTSFPCKYIREFFGYGLPFTDATSSTKRSSRTQQLPLPPGKDIALHWPSCPRSRLSSSTAIHLVACTGHSASDFASRWHGAPTDRKYWRLTS